MKRVKQVREIKRYKLPVTKHGDEMYSMGNIVNKNVISLYGNRW